MSRRRHCYKMLAIFKRPSSLKIPAPPIKRLFRMFRIPGRLFLPNTDFFPLCGVLEPTSRKNVLIYHFVPTVVNAKDSRNAWLKDSDAETVFIFDFGVSQTFSKFNMVKIEARILRVLEEGVEKCDGRVLAPGAILLKVLAVRWWYLHPGIGKKLRYIQDTGNFQEFLEFYKKGTYPSPVDVRFEDKLKIRAVK